MSPLSIVTDPDAPVLRTKAKKVKDILAPDTQALIPRMFASMHQAEGIGLAAPQIGYSLRLCVIELDAVRHVFVNPMLTAYSKEKAISEEGCLSLPGQYFPVERHVVVTVRYRDTSGTACKLKARGLLAIVLQHEIDHLDGILIIDRYRQQKTKQYASVQIGNRPII